MLTPQNELCNLSYKINQLINMFEGKEDELGIFDHVKELYMSHEVLLKRLENIEDQLALIIKFLGKSNV